MCCKQGNGTASIFQDDPRVTTFDMHGTPPPPPPLHPQPNTRTRTRTHAHPTDMHIVYSLSEPSACTSLPGLCTILYCAIYMLQLVSFARWRKGRTMVP